MRITNDQLEYQFKNQQLTPCKFDHYNHLRLAWLNINKYGLDTTLQKLPYQFEQYTSFHGAKNKYNLTLTIAAIKTVYHFYLKSPHLEFEVMIQTYPRLLNHFKDLISAHYSYDIFLNPQAKIQFLPPDLLPYDG